MEEQILQVLKDYMGALIAKSILQSACTRAGTDPSSIGPGTRQRILDEMKTGIKTFVQDHKLQSDCITALENLFKGGGMSAPSSSGRITGSIPTPGQTSVPIARESDVLVARTRVWKTCEKLGFPATRQTRAATIVSELARNILLYAEKGEIDIREMSDGGKKSLEIIATDRGPGITDVDAVLRGESSSGQGLGMGLKGVKTMSDFFHIDSGPSHGTRITVHILSE